MENREIPTAEKFLKSKKVALDVLSEDELKDRLWTSDVLIWIEEYANLKTKHHVQRALDAAAEKAEDVLLQGNEITKQSILNAYPLDQIK